MLRHSRLPQRAIYIKEYDDFHVAVYEALSILVASRNACVEHGWGKARVGNQTKENCPIFFEKPHLLFFFPRLVVGTILPSAGAFL